MAGSSSRSRNNSAKSAHSYVCTLSEEQIEQLRGMLAERGWELRDAPHAFWRAQSNDVVVIAYRSGKLVVQGKGTAEFVQFTLEPGVLGEARFGYEEVLAVEENPRMFAPHIGVDESGKGDYFGPLVTAAVYVDGNSARELLSMGVRDSKKIKGGDRRMRSLASDVRKAVRGKFAIVPVGPEAYNRLFGQMRNTNRILAWAHARAIENVLEKVPDCPRAISDQFGSKDLVQSALMKRGRRIELEQYPRAEADVAVAAASVLARAEFVRRLELLGKELGVSLPKGASGRVIEVARELVARHGAGVLEKAAKVHFRTTRRVTEG